MTTRSARPSSALTPAALQARFGSPSPKAVRKKHATIDRHDASFIARSPFVIMATASSSGHCDASPKGGSPGFVLVVDDKSLLIPDYAGNCLFDGIQNLLENPRVGLLFVLPGERWTLRVNGTARLLDDAETLELLRRHDPKGKPPQLAIEVTVEECFFHCPKSLLAADVWNAAKHQRFDDLPSMFQS